MLSSTPDYVTWHVQDRTPRANSPDRARHRHEGVAEYWVSPYRSERGVSINSYPVAIYQELSAHRPDH